MRKFFKQIFGATFLELTLGYWIGIILIFLAIGVGFQACEYMKPKLERCIQASMRTCPTKLSDNWESCAKEVRNQCMKAAK